MFVWQKSALEDLQMSCSERAHNNILRYATYPFDPFPRVTIQQLFSLLHQPTRRFLDLSAITKQRPLLPCRRDGIQSNVPGGGRELRAPELLVLAAEAAVKNGEFDTAREACHEYFLDGGSMDQFFCRALFAKVWSNFFLQRLTILCIRSGEQ